MNTEKNGITVRPGCELGDELHSCIEIIKEGEAVNVASATDELPEATFVAVKRVDGLLVGVGAIKRQRHWYARSIAKKVVFRLMKISMNLVTSLSARRIKSKESPLRCLRAY